MNRNDNKLNSEKTNSIEIKYNKLNNEFTEYKNRCEVLL